MSRCDKMCQVRAATQTSLARASLMCVSFLASHNFLAPAMRDLGHKATPSWLGCPAIRSCGHVAPMDAHIHLYLQVIYVYIVGFIYFQ